MMAHCSTVVCYIYQLPLFLFPMVYCIYTHVCFLLFVFYDSMAINKYNMQLNSFLFNKQLHLVHIEQ